MTHNYYKLHRDGVITGSLNCFCLACDLFLDTPFDAAEHIETSEHINRLSAVQYPAKFLFDDIMKFKWGYYCKFCNLLMPIASKVNVHINEHEHKHNKGILLLKPMEDHVIAFDNTVIEVKAWHGLIDGVCSLCNVEFEDEDEHKADASHSLNLVLKPIQFGANNAIYRHLDDTAVQCLTCNKLLASAKMWKHFDDTEHHERYVDRHIEINVVYHGIKLMDAKPTLQEIETQDGATNEISVTKNDDESITRKIDNSQDKNEKLSTNNTSELLESIAKYQSKGININLERESAFCKKCSKPVAYDVTEIENHIEHHTSTAAEDSDLLYPSTLDQKFNRVDVNDKTTISSDDNVIKNDDESNTQNIDNSQDKNEKLSTNNTSELLESIAKYQSKGITVNLESESAFCKKKTKSVKFDQMEIENNMEHHISTVDDDSDLLYPSTLDQKLNRVDENDKTTISSDDIVIKNDDESNTQNIDNSQDKNEKLSTNNASELLESIAKYQSKGININLERESAFCKKCSKPVAYDVTEIENHIEHHKSTAAEDSDLLYPSTLDQKLNRVDVNDKTTISSDDNVIKNDDESNTQNIDNSQDKNEKLSTNNTSELLESIAKYQSKGIKINLESESAFCKKKSKPVKFYQMEIENNMKHHTSTVDDDSDLLYPSTLDQKLNQVDENDKTTISSDDIVIQNDDESNTQNIDNGQDKNEKLSTNNTSELLESIAKYQSKGININLERESAFCKKCSKPVAYDVTEIENHIEHHTSTAAEDSDLLYPSTLDQKLNRVDVNDKTAISSDDNVIKNDDESNTQNIDNSQDKNEKLSTNNTSELLESIAKYQSKGINVNLESESAFCKKKSKPVKFDQMEIENNMEHHTSTVDDDSDLLYPSTLDQKLNRVDENDKTTISSNDIVIKNDDESNTQNIDNSQDKNEKLSTNNTSELLESIAKYQSKGININLEMELAFCKKCSKPVAYDVTEIENHIEHHTSTAAEDSDLLYPSTLDQKLNRVDVSDKTTISSDDNSVTKNDDESNTQNIDRSQDNNEKLSMKNTSKLLESVTKYQSKGINVNLETESAFCKKKSKSVTNDVTDIENHIEHHTSVADESDLLYPSTLDQKLNRVDVNEKTTISSDDNSVTKNDDESNTQNIDSSQDNNEKLSIKNTSKLFEFVAKYQSKGININLETESAFCKKCSKPVVYDVTEIENHMKHHTSTVAEDSDLLYPCIRDQKLNRVDIKDETTKSPDNNQNTEIVNDFVKACGSHDENNASNKEDIQVESAHPCEVVPPVKKLEKCGQEEEVRNFAKANKITYHGGNTQCLCRVCKANVPASLRSLKEHVEGANHKKHAVCCVTRPEPPKDLVKQLTKEFVVKFHHVQEHSAVIINVNFCILFKSYHFILEMGSRMKCIVCKVNFPRISIIDHSKKREHKKKWERVPVIISEKAEFIREVRLGVFHCGYCHLVVTGWAEMRQHLESSDHKDSKTLWESRLNLHLTNMDQSEIATIVTEFTCLALALV